jgi:hypothetical protein
LTVKDLGVGESKDFVDKFPLFISHGMWLIVMMLEILLVASWYCTALNTAGIDLPPLAGLS